jgi:glycosyltransferase involved in cell wall biosynthesis
MYRVLAFTVKPRASADSRYRILQYVPFAERDGVKVHHRSLMSDRFFDWQMQNKHILWRILLLPWMLLLRLWQVLVEAPGYDAVWILREMSPLGPPIFERLLVWRCRRVLLDVDDALHIVDKESSSWLPRLFRDGGKFGRMASCYSAVVCGNSFLAQFYRSQGGIVHIIPTVVNSDDYAGVQPSPSRSVRIGWIGTPLNRHHIELVGAALVSLAQERQFEVSLVGILDPFDWQIPQVRYIRWTLADEIAFFEGFDIGIMPLRDSLFARGKCAFKLIQYMAAGLPVIASPVGANVDVVHNGENGFLAATDEEWLIAMRQLIDDVELRGEMGRKGRELVRESYSVQSAWPVYRSILIGKPEGTETR